MSEILRAILDASAIDSQPAFYTANILSVSTAGALTYASRNTFFEMKPDVWFLMMGFTRILQDQRNNGNPNLPADFSTVRLTSLKRSQPFDNAATPQYLLNSILNNSRTLDEYVLFEPAETVQVTMDIPVISGFAQNWQSFLIMSGIEYRMPPGRNWGSPYGQD